MSAKPGGGFTRRRLLRGLALFASLVSGSRYGTYLWADEPSSDPLGKTLPRRLLGRTGANAAQSTVDIRDICAIAAKALVEDGHEGKTYVITGPEALTFQQVAETLSNVLGREIRYIDVPLSVAADGMRKAGMPDWNVRIVSELLDYFASGAAATVSDAVPRLLGRPAISFEQFVKDHRGALSK